MKKKGSLLLAAVLVLGTCFGCGSKADDTAKDTKAAETKAAETKAAGETQAAQPAADGDVITLAVVGPQTGDNAEFGKSMKTAAQIAVDEWNEKGGVLGKQIKLIDYDDANTSEQAASIAQKIVGDPSVSAVIGHFSSGVAMTASEVYQEAGIPYIALAAAHRDLTGIGDYIFRNNQVSETEANAMLQMVNYLGVKKYGILNPNTDIGVSNTEEIEKLIEKYKGTWDAELVDVEYYEDGTVDFSSTISKFEAAGVEAVYSCGAYAQCAPFVKQYRESNKDVKFILSAGCFSQEFLELAGKDGEGVILGSSFFYGSEREVVKNFSEKYVKIYGANPSTFAAQSYDAIYAIMYAMERGGSADRTAIKDNLYKTDFEGLCGKVTFDENGNCPKQQALLEIKDGQYVEIPNGLMTKVDYEKSLGL